jgi:hypothetical protein
MTIRRSSLQTKVLAIVADESPRETATPRASANAATRPAPAKTPQPVLATAGGDDWEEF